MLPAQSWKPRPRDAKWARPGVFFVICAVLAFTAAAQAQQPSRPAQNGAPQQPAVLRVESRLVQVNVVVHDKNGAPVTGLSKEDFVLKEDGQPQPIALFELATDQTSGRPKILPANYFSNRLLEDGGVPPSVTVILFDGINTPFDDRAYARNQILKFLRQVQPDDRIALYFLGRQLSVLHDFTHSAADLVAALNGKAASQGGIGYADAVNDSPIGPSLNAFMEEAARLTTEYFAKRRVALTIAAFEVIANHLAGLPGRKNLIWVSAAFPMTMGFSPYSRAAAPGRPAVLTEGFFEEVQRAARALSNANVTIYPVDARGLVTTRGGFPANRDTMASLAGLTGGMAFFDNNDIRGCIRRAVNDARVNYVLGFYPSRRKWDGTFHRLQVAVKRPNLEVRARQGYYAVPDVPLDAKGRNVELLKTAVSSLDATEIGLLAHAQMLQKNGGAELNLTMLLNPRSVRFEEKEGRWDGAIDFFFVQRRAADSQVLKASDQTLRLHLLPEHYEKGLREGLTITKDVPVQNGADELRIIARDANSEALGSITIPLRPLAADCKIAVCNSAR